MAEPTHPLPGQPTPAKPQPNRIADAPATVQACAGDFGSGASVRADSVKRDAHARR